MEKTREVVLPALLDTALDLDRDYLKNLPSPALHPQALVAEGSRTPEVFLNLGYCLQLAGRDEEAVEQFLVAHDLDPGNTSVLRNLVVVLRRLGRQAEAQRFQALFESAVGAARAPR